MFSRTNVNSRQYLPVHSNFRAGMPRFSPQISWHGACEKAGMTRFLVGGAFVAAALLANLPTARAEFFSLSGRFQCLESGAAICGDAQLVVQPLPVVPPVSPAPVEPTPVATATSAVVAAVAPVESVIVSVTG